MKFGIFKGKAVLGTEQWGDTSGGHPQIAVTMRMNADGEIQESTTYLIFSPGSAPYSFARLKAMGWEGSSAADFAKIGVKGIDKNEVDVRLFQEPYEGKQQVKCEIMSGGAPTLSKPTSKEDFAAKVAAIMGQPAGAGASSKAPFSRRHHKES